MRNWKMLGLASAAVLVAAAAIFSLSPDKAAVASVPSVVTSSQIANVSHAASYTAMSHMRVAQSCIEHGQTCTINGTPCCQSNDACKGTFPNTTCQAK